MAKKINTSQMSEAIRGRAEINNRLPAPPTPALYLMQLRTQATKLASHRRRLQISFETDVQVLMPRTIKITHAD